MTSSLFPLPCCCGSSSSGFSGSLGSCVPCCPRMPATTTVNVTVTGNGCNWSGGVTFVWDDQACCWDGPTITVDPHVFRIDLFGCCNDALNPSACYCTIGCDPDEYLPTSFSCDPLFIQFTGVNPFGGRCGDCTNMTVTITE